MAKITANTQYCSCIEFEQKKTKGVAKAYKVKKGSKCSDVLNRQAHINSWCCLFKRWQDYLGSGVIRNDIQLFTLMAKDPRAYYQEVKRMRMLCKWKNDKRRYDESSEKNM